MVQPHTIDFIWTFPLYILATGHQRDPVTGSYDFSHPATILTPPMLDEPHLAIFTDLDLAESFSNILPGSDRWEALPMGLGEMILLLNMGEPKFQQMVIDLNPKTMIGRCAPSSNLIAAIKWEIGQSDPSD